VKIAHIFESISDSGVSNVILRLEESMKKMGHEVDCITWKKPTVPFEGVTLKQVEIEGLSNSKGFKKNFLKLFFGVRIAEMLCSGDYVKKLNNKLSLKSYDLIFVHGLSVIPMWKIRESSFFVLHNTKSKLLLSRRFPFLNVFLRKMYFYIYKSHRLLTVSNGIKKDIIDCFKLPEKHFVQSVFNPFPINKIKSLSDEVLSSKIKVPQKYLMSMGRLVRAKRFDRLILAYKKSGVNMPLYIFGSGGKKGQLVRLIEKLDLKDKVFIFDYISNPFPYLKNAHAFILSSDFEGFANVLIESLICGTPIVSTNCKSGPNEILVNEYSKWLCAVNDSDQLANLIVEIVKNPYQVNPAMYQRFSSEKIAQHYLDCINY